MPSNTTNYNLTTYDRTGDTGELFIDYRDDQAGTGSSNMVKIDTQMKVNADSVTDLGGVGRTTETVKGNNDLIVSNDVDISNIETDIDQNIKPNIRYFDTTGTDTYAVTTSGTFQLVDGAVLNVNFTNENTGDSTIDADGSGARDIRDPDTLEYVKSGILSGYKKLSFDLGTNTYYLLNEQASNKIRDSFSLDLAKAYGEVKTADDGQDETVWSGGTPVSDTTNVKIGSQSVGFTTINGTITPTANNLDSINFEALNNGSASPTSDWLKFISKLGALVTDVKIRLCSDAVFSGNYEEYTFAGLTLSEWNYLDFQKSSFTSVGTGADLSDIQSIQLPITATGAETFNLQLVQLVKSNAAGTAPNPLESQGFTIDAGAEFAVVNEFGVNNLIEFGAVTSAALTNGLSGENTYSNGTFTTEIESGGGSDAYALNYYLDTDNYVQLAVINGELRLRVRQSGTDVDTLTPILIDTGDRVLFELSVENGNITASALKNNDTSTRVQLSGQTAQSSGFIKIGTRGVGVVQKYPRISATEIAHAYHADIAEVAKGLTEQAKCEYQTVGSRSIPNNSPEIVSFQAKIKDNAGFGNLTVSETDFTIPETGDYDIMASAAFDAAATNGYRRLDIRRDGVVIGRNQISGQPYIQAHSTITEFVKGDVITVYVRHTEGAAIDLETATENATKLIIRKRS